MKHYNGLLVVVGLLFSSLAWAEGSEFNVNEERSCYACNPQVNLAQYDTAPSAPEQTAAPGEADGTAIKGQN